MRGSRRINTGGLPHSDMHGSKRICRSPCLIAACHVLHRLLAPRHPSCALCSLINSSSSPRQQRQRDGKFVITETPAADHSVPRTLIQDLSFSDGLVFRLGSQKICTYYPVCRCQRTSQLLSAANGSQIVGFYPKSPGKKSVDSLASLSSTSLPPTQSPQKTTPLTTLTTLTLISTATPNHQPVPPTKWWA